MPDSFKPWLSLGTRRGAVLTWLGLLSIALVGFTVDFQRRQCAWETLVASQQKLTLEHAHSHIRDRLGWSLDDLHLIADNPITRAFVLGGEAGDRALLESSLVAMMRTRLRRFDQIRYLDAEGRELIRINNTGSAPARVPEADLQDKSHRYYVRDCRALDAGQTYLSPLDLNIEHGVVESPPKPMIRMCTPVVDARGQRRGMVVINVLAKPIIDDLRALARTVEKPIWLLNAEGDWLMGRTPDEEWGFMFADNRHPAYPEVFPDLWSQLQTHSSPSALKIGETDAPLTVTTFEPARDLGNASETIHTHPGMRWYLLSTLTPAAIDHQRHTILRGHALSFVPLAALFGLLSLWLNRAIRHRTQARSDLEDANRELTRLSVIDPLTGLGNRRQLDQTLRAELRRALRQTTMLSVIMIDIDCFKAFNDARGHTEGDRCLRRIAQALEDHARRPNDLPARYGGEEFCMILPDTDHPGALHVAETLRDAIEALRITHPTHCTGPWVTASLGVVSIAPSAEITPETVLEIADTSLYEAKQQGKNRVIGKRIVARSTPTRDDEVPPDLEFP